MQEREGGGEREEEEGEGVRHDRGSNCQPSAKHRDDLQLRL